MECFIAWTLAAFWFIQYWTTRTEANHYRDSYFRVIDQWCASVRQREGR